MIPTCLALFALACDPAPALVGEGLVSETEEGYSLHWRVDAEADEIFLDLATTDDGGVAVLVKQESGRRRLREYSPDGATVLDVALEGHPDQLLVEDDGFLVAGSFLGRLIPEEQDQAAVWHLSASGETLGRYLQPLVGMENSFADDLARSPSGEIAIVVRNAPDLPPGLPWQQVVRITEALEPLGEPLPFDENVELEYDEEGHLFVVAFPEAKPAIVHDLDDGAALYARQIPCRDLIDSREGPVCFAAEERLQFTHVTSGATIEPGRLGFDVPAVQAVVRDSFVLYGSVADSTELRVVEYWGGEIQRTAAIPKGGDTQYIGAYHAGVAADGAVYLGVREIAPSGSCGRPPDQSCWTMAILRLSPS